MLTYLQDTGAYESWNGSAYTDINDNTAAIPKSTVTTSQDLIVADGASSVTRLGVGANDQILSVVGGEVAWADAAGGSPITTEGDLILGDVSGAAARLPIGAAGRLLSSNGTTATWTAPGAGGEKDWVSVSSGSTYTGSSTFTITGLSLYDNYLFLWMNVSASSNWRLNLQVNSTSAGKARGLYATSASAIGRIAEDETYMAYGDAIEGCSGSALISGGLKTGKAVVSLVSGIDAGSGGARHFITNGYINKTATISSIGIKTNAGTLDGGTYELWGA